MNVAVISLYVPLVAVLIDLIVADPKGMPHPVQYIGSALTRIEGKLRSMNINLKYAGMAVAVGLSLAVALVVKLLCAVPYLGVLIALYFSWAGLALGGLLREGRKVSRLIEADRIDDAREALAGLVSRDTSNMDADQLRTALAETLSENLNDGFTAPFLFLCIFGPAGMWFYKAVSTMDSMWGYKTEDYRELGWGAAKLDDILAFIPARVTAFLMLGAGKLLKLDVEKAYDNMIEDSRKTESPNAGWPMAAAAWLMGAAMGGTAVYFGETKEKPQLGPDGTWDAGKIRILLTLIRNSGILGAICMAVYFTMVYLAK